MTKLTDALLIRLGFRGEGRDVTNKPAYRLKMPRNKNFGYYHFEIQVVLGNYPGNNGNNGILSLYRMGTKDAHMFAEEEEDMKVDFVLWENEDVDGHSSKGGIKYIDIKPTCIPIAWHVTTLERLNEIYTALTQNPPLTPKK